MATSSAPSILIDNSAEKINGFKLMRLIVDGGTEALRNVFAGIHPGTREWVFEQVSTWLNDQTISNRAFVITGVAGMAWQLSKVFPEYQNILVEKLSGNLGQSLNDMNVEGLFSMLFKEPFSSIPDPGKPVLIVLDAVDESTYDGRQELASLISQHFHKLPPYIRFVITTRPEKNLMQKFEKLAPLYLEATDERNLTDVKLVIEKRISTASLLSTAIDNLAKVADGNMLYAFFLSEIYKENPSAFNINDVPKGIAMLYKNYLKRLEGELANVGVSKGGFLSFLSALVVAKEPLPIGFIGILLVWWKNLLWKQGKG